MLRKFSALAALAALALLPNQALSLRLFEGNLGYDSDWLYVLDSTAMGDRVYWYDLGDDVTYEAQFALDESFEAPVLDLVNIVDNYVEPGLGPDFYYFRAREVHFSNAAGSWSETGTLEVVEDREPPTVRILAPLDGQVFMRQDTLAVQLEVSDDTVLRLARFTIGGDYAGTLGLKTENSKVKPSFGEPRTVAFNVQIPKNAGKGLLEISVAVSDVMGRAITDSVVIDVGGSSTEKAAKRGRGKPR